MARKRPSRVSGDLLLNRIVLRPEQVHARAPESLGRPFEPFEAVSLHNGQTVTGWHFPPPTQAQPSDAATTVQAAPRPPMLVLLNPPNQGTMAEVLEHAALLLECGCGVLMYDYQGFGTSGGLADVRTLSGDAQGVLAWAGRRGILTPATRLVVMGVSLGTLVAIHLAAQPGGCPTGGPTATAHIRPAGLILEGAVEPFRALRRSFGPLGAAVAAAACTQIPPELDAARQIGAVSCSTLFIHGVQDPVSSIDDARELAGRCRDATLWAPEDCHHLDIVRRHRGQYRSRLQQFFLQAIVR